MCSFFKGDCFLVCSQQYEWDMDLRPPLHTHTHKKNKKAPWKIENLTRTDKDPEKLPMLLGHICAALKLRLGESHGVTWRATNGS